MKPQPQRSAPVPGRSNVGQPNPCLLMGWLRLSLCCSLLLSPSAAAAATTYRVVPAEAPRFMWENANGYCGETSLQVAGLQLGLWVGQNQARHLAGGEALLDVNYDLLLNKLHLWHTNWSGGVTRADRQNFLEWARRALTAGNQVIFGAKTHAAWGIDNDYDHILNADAVALPALAPPLLTITAAANQQCSIRILNAATNVTYYLQWCPALAGRPGQWSTLATSQVGQTVFTVGRSAQPAFFRVCASENQFDGNNSLYYADSIDGAEYSLTFAQWVDGYTNVWQDYYLPPKATVTLVNGAKVNALGRQYGTAITGQDGRAECLPLTLTSVVPQTEPNVTLGAEPAFMNGVVYMTGLMPGANYALLRWDCDHTTLGSVPWTNLLGSASLTNFEYQFTATNATADREVSFLSDGITLFRLVMAR